VEERAVETTLTVEDLTTLTALIRKAGGIDSLQECLAALAEHEEQANPGRSNGQHGWRDDRGRMREQRHSA